MLVLILSLSYIIISSLNMDGMVMENLENLFVKRKWNRSDNNLITVM